MELAVRRITPAKQTNIAGRKHHGATWLWALGGLGAGYLILSPLAMVFFHLSHHDLDPQMVSAMHSSVWGSVRDAFSGQLALWWLSFAGLGAALGVVVGSVVETLQRRRAEIERHAGELAGANLELEEAYRRVLQADKLASLGLVAGTVIHDLNNHLQKLLLLAELEQQWVAHEEREHCPWSKVRLHVGKMRELTESVRRFARKSSAKKTATDVNQVLGEALLLMRQALSHAGIELCESLRARPAVVQADPNQLTQVFVNLLENALDAVPRGGRLSVETRSTGAGVEISVADTGQGIAPEHLERIFEVFFTTKPEGRGTRLGLAICRRIAEEHQGSLTVESELGRGTTFRVTLPFGLPVKGEAAARRPLHRTAPKQARQPSTGGPLMRLERMLAF